MSQEHVLPPHTILRAVCIVVAVLGIAELFSRWIYSCVSVTHSDRDLRNPYATTMWLPYTEPRSRKNREKRIIVITNSQGYQMESSDATRGYIAHLQATLRTTQPEHTWVVANWSIIGLKIPELAVMVAQAAKHQPDVLVLSISMHPFVLASSLLPMSAMPNDVKWLSYRSEHRRLLQKTALREQLDFRPLLWPYAHSDLFFWGRWFFATRRKPRPHEIYEHKNFVPSGQGRIAPWTRHSDRLLRSLYEIIHIAIPNTPILLVHQPLCLDAWEPHSRQQQVYFFRRLQAHFQDQPFIRRIDAVNWLPCHYFSAPAHLNDAGHRQFAHRLFPYLRDMLKRLPSSPASRRTP